MFLVTTTMCR